MADSEAKARQKLAEAEKKTKKGAGGFFNSLFGGGGGDDAADLYIQVSLLLFGAFARFLVLSATFIIFLFMSLEAQSVHSCVTLQTLFDSKSSESRTRNRGKPSTNLFPMP